MKTFLAVFIGTPDMRTRSGWDALPEDQRKERETAGINAWMKWIDTHKAAIIDGGSPLGKTKQVSPTGIADIKNALTAYTLVKAESHEAAARMFEGHPHFTIFPGESIEIMECLPIPGQ